MKNHKRSENKKLNFLFSLLSVCFWLIVWHIAATMANRNLILKIPLPLDTFRVFLSDLGRREFWDAVSTSLGHIALGFVSAVLIGAIGAVIAGNSRFFKTLSAPLLHLIRSVPVAAFIFIAWLWIPAALLPSFISALMVIPIIWSHVDAGLSSADKRYSELGRVYGMREREIILRIRLPLLAPHLRAGCITGLGIAWKSGVAAEVICNPSGSVGALLQKGKAAIEYEEVFAVTLSVVLLSLLLERLLKRIWKK